MLSRLVIAFLPRSKSLLISWLHHENIAVTICNDFGVQENKACHCFHCFPIYLPWSDGTGCHDPSLLNEKNGDPLSPQQVTADSCFCRRPSDTQRKVWLSLCRVSWCTHGFVWALQASLMAMGFDSKRDFAPPTILLGLLLCPWTWGIFFGWDPTLSKPGLSNMWTMNF